MAILIVSPLARNSADTSAKSATELTSIHESGTPIASKHDPNPKFSMSNFVEPSSRRISRNLSYPKIPTSALASSTFPVISAPRWNKIETPPITGIVAVYRRLFSLFTLSPQTSKNFNVDSYKAPSLGIAIIIWEISEVIISSKIRNFYAVESGELTEDKRESTFIANPTAGTSSLPPNIFTNPSYLPPPPTTV